MNTKEHIAHLHKNEIISLYKSGKSLNFIGSVVGIRCKSTVASYLRLWGVNIRRTTTGLTKYPIDHKKVCISCNFSGDNSKFNSKQSRCKVCQKQYHKLYYQSEKIHILKKGKEYNMKNNLQVTQYKTSYYQRNSETIREKDIKQKYGLDRNSYKTLYDLQEGKCPICQSDLVGGIMGGKMTAIDHSHSSGKVRGILCSKCNMMLGLANDNPNLLLMAIKYLETYSD